MNIITSETVISEVHGAIIKAVNNLCDSRNIRSNVTRLNLVNQAQKNSQTLYSLISIEIIDHTEILKQIDEFYNSLSSDTRLIELRNKKGLNTPGPKDKKILAECCQIALTDDAFFITGDADFSIFYEEIKEKFNIQILAIMDLVSVQREWGWN